MGTEFTTIWLLLLSSALFDMSLAAKQDTGECSVTTVITETRPCGSPTIIGTSTCTSTSTRTGTSTSTNGQDNVAEEHNTVQLNKHFEGWFGYYFNINL